MDNEFVIGEDVQDIAHLEARDCQLVAHVLIFLALAGGHVVVGVDINDAPVGLDHAHTQHLLALVFHALVVGLLEGGVVKLREFLQGSGIVELDEHAVEFVAPQFLIVVKHQQARHADERLAGHLGISAAGQDDRRAHVRVTVLLRAGVVLEHRVVITPYLLAQFSRKFQVLFLVIGMCRGQRQQHHQQCQAFNH